MDDSEGDVAAGGEETTESAGFDLPRATLDTLPINVAVLDAAGTIRFTNRAWREFEGGDPTRPPPEEVGVNYLEAIDPDVDGYARRALEGLRDVLDGERDAFTLEYPCHSPEERRWFLMRVSRFSREGETRLVVAHSDITERKLAELDAARRAAEVRQERRHLEHLLARINGLLEDITHGLVAAETREEVDSLVCSRLVEAEAYRAAWIAERDLAADRLVVRESAGAGSSGGGGGDLAPDGIDLTATDDPAVAAFEAGDPVVIDAPDPGVAPWLDRAVDGGVGAVAAFPLAFGSVSYGVLVVCAERRGAFNERELAVLSALARATASTINAVEGRRILSTTAVLELEFAISDPSFPLCRLSAEADCRVASSGAVHRDDGSLLLFLTAETDDADGVREAAAALESVEAATVLADHDGEVLLELDVTESVVLTVAEYGGVTTALEAEDGLARLTVELPYGADARAVYEALADSYPGTDLDAYRERERPVQTRQAFKSDLDDRLTERQRTALRSAYLAGYFEWPRPTDGDDLAEAMDVTRPTFHQHLRAAQRKLLDGLYARDP